MSFTRYRLAHKALYDMEKQAKEAAEQSGINPVTDADRFYERLVSPYAAAHSATWSVSVYNRTAPFSSSIRACGGGEGDSDWPGCMRARWTAARDGSRT